MTIVLLFFNIFYRKTLKLYEISFYTFVLYILPYFDYCLSLIIYFPSAAYQSLCNCFNLCLFKLFNFKPEYNSEEEDEEKIMSDFLVKLQSYQLFTLQARIYSKLLIFAHGIKTNARSPLELRSLINPVNQIYMLTI